MSEVHYTNKVITRWYRPPELLLGATDYGPAIDMWSVGCIFAELLLQHALFPGVDDHDQLFIIFQTCGTPSSSNWPNVEKLPLWEKLQPKKVIPKNLREKFRNCPPLAIELLEKLLEMCPNQRITAKQALEHEWFTKIPPKSSIQDLPLYQCNELSAKKKRKQEREVLSPSKKLKQEERPLDMKKEYGREQDKKNLPPPPSRKSFENRPNDDRRMYKDDRRSYDDRRNHEDQYRKEERRDERRDDRFRDERPRDDRRDDRYRDDRRPRDDRRRDERPRDHERPRERDQKLDSRPRDDRFRDERRDDRKRDEKKEEFIEKRLN